MGKSWWIKFSLTMLAVLGAIGTIYPTFSKLDPEKTKYPYTQKINLGLDLQGGLYLVLGADFNKVFRDVIDRQAINVEGLLKEKNLPAKEVKVKRDASADDPMFEVLVELAQKEQIRTLLKAEYPGLRLVGEEAGKITLALATDYRNEIREKTINQSIEVIRNRIDEFGVSEPVISSQGNSRLVVELPGIKEVDRAKALIGQTAKLEFRIVEDQKLPGAQLMSLIADIEKQNGITFKKGEKFSDYVAKINQFAKGKIPEGTEIAFQRPKELNGEIGENKIPYLLNSRADVTGDDLSDAIVQFDPENQMPHVGFNLNPRGAVKFGNLTKENIGKRLAIVLDTIVHSAPVIQSQITDRGQITLGQGDYEGLMREAKDLAIVLRAGALPAQLDFLEQRVIGPSLGQDSIRSGALGAIVGTVCIILFILFYYRVSGVIATVSLAFNLVFILSCLVLLGATLTMPGIAGIALTVGTAVDSNVVIYERIRDELRAGKSIFGAVEAGFQKAYAAIFDANMTNACAAIILLIYGTGPIKGFAVTLLVGIVTTLFSAVFICKLLYDYYLKSLQDRNQTAISI